MTEDNLISVEDICEQTWEPLYRFIYYKVQNREEAEDITQETYTRSLSWPGFDRIRPGRYMAFFRTVAMNIIRTAARKSQGNEYRS